MIRLDGSPVVAARSLLGTLVTHAGVTVRVTETEAYAQDDAASHTFRGPTPRNATMFGPSGRLYVYFSYGIHWNANVSCGPVGAGQGVLLRAGEVVAGIELARGRRGRSTDRDLARGPGRLCQALAITGALDGTDLLADEVVTLRPGRRVTAAMIDSGPRVGVSKAADLPWRFWLADDRFVSAYKRSPRAPAPTRPEPV